MSFSVQSFSFNSLLTSAKMTALQDSVTHIKSMFQNEHRWSDSNANLGVHSLNGASLHDHTFVQSSDMSDMAGVGGRELGGTGRDGSSTMMNSAWGTANHIDKNYTDYTINAGVTLTFSGDGPCIIRATSTIDIQGSIIANYGGASEGNNGFFGGSGGGGSSGTGGATHVAGGGLFSAGKDVNNDININFILMTLNASNLTDHDATTVVSYGGGGGGSSASGIGGNGGGYIYLEAPQIIVGSGGKINADGVAGTGNAGDGGGGIIHLVYHSLSLVGGADVTTPAGADGAGTGGPGGDGLLIRVQRKIT